ncbi:MAG: PqqD family protein [Bacteroidales bacterium]|nr:PqqD family protein [Bacteroidales bacterium]
MSQEISQHSIIRRNPNIAFTYLDKEVMLLNPDTGQYYSFNKVGAYIWELIAEPIAFEVLIHHLMLKFEVEKNKCEKDTLQFLNLLYQKKMIIIQLKA